MMWLKPLVQRKRYAVSLFASHGSGALRALSAFAHLVLTSVDDFD